MAKRPPSKNEARLHPLAARAVKGDARAYAQLLEVIAEVARGYIRRKTSDAGHVEDVAQEILISVHKALPTYEPTRPFMPWLAAIMHFRLTDWLRKQYHVSEAGKVALEDVEHFLEGDVTDLPFEFEYIDKALAQLSPKQQAVIECMYKQELSVAETAEKLGMGLSAVKVTAHRAYKKLRILIAQEDI